MSDGLRAVAFDLDDTLFPERAYVASGFAAVADWLAQRGLGEAGLMRSELGRLFDAGPRIDVFQRWLAARGLPLDPWQGQMAEVYRGHTPRIEPYPEVRPLLERLRRRVRLGLLTEGRRAAQARKLEALHLGEFFQEIVILDQDETEAWKPNQVAFERLLERLGIAGAQAAYVGDNPAKDFRGARQLGLRTVRVRRADGLHAGREPAGPEDAPDLELADLAELDRRLGVDG